MLSRRGPAIALLSATLFAAVTTEMLPVGLLPQLTRAFGVDEAGIGWWVSAYALVVAVGAIPLTAFLSRFPRRTALVALLLAYALSNVVVVLAPGYTWALLARLIGGLAHAGIFTVVVATAVGLVSPARAGRALVVVNGGVTMALTAGVPLGTAVGTALGWRWAFGLVAALLLLLALTTLRLVPGSLVAHGAAPPVLPALRGRGLLQVAAATTVITLGHYAVYTYVTPIVLASGVSEGAVSLVLFGYGAGGFVGLLVAGLIVDRHPVAALRGAVLLVAGCLVTAALAGGTVATVAAVVAWGAGFGTLPTLLQTAALRASGGSDAAPAVVNATFNVGIAGGAWIGGGLLVAGAGAQALVGGALVLLGLLFTGGAASRAAAARQDAGSSVRSVRG